MSDVSEFGTKVKHVTATIASSGTTSGAVDMQGCTAVAFATPGTITGTTLTFEGSIDGGATYETIKADTAGNTLTYTVAISSSYPMDAKIFAAFDKIKVVMVAQSQETIIKIKPFPV